MIQMTWPADVYLSDVSACSSESDLALSRSCLLLPMPSCTEQEAPRHGAEKTEPQDAVMRLGRQGTLTTGQFSEPLNRRKTMSNSDEPLKVHRYKCHLCGEVYSDFGLARQCLRICREKRQAEQAIADGTIAEAEAAADEAEHVAETQPVSGDCNPDLDKPEPLDDPWDIMAEYLCIIHAQMCVCDPPVPRVQNASAMAMKLLPKLQANHAAEVKALRETVNLGPLSGKLTDAVSRAIGTGLDDAEKGLE